MPLALALVVWPAAASAQDAAQAPAPAKPTVGSIVLLANDTGHDHDETLRQGLLEPDARVRMVAGRVIGVVPHTDLVRELIGALAREQDAAAAAELARDVLYVGGASQMDFVKVQVRRFGPAVAPVVAEWTGRMQPTRLVELLPELATLAGPRVNRLTGIVAMAAETHPDAEDTLVRAWMAHAPPGQWTFLLQRVFPASGDVTRAAAMFKDALQSERPTVREETLWLLIDHLAAKQDLPKDVLEAGLPRDGGDQTEWETFGRELIARRLKKTRPTDRSELIARATGRSRGYVSNLRGLAELTAAERAGIPEPPPRQPPWERFAGWTGPTLFRTMPAVVPGAIADTLSSGGCALDARRVGAGVVNFGPDGRPRTISRDARALPTSCLDAFTALTRLAVADAEHTVRDVGQGVLLPLAQEFVACSSDAAAVDSPVPVPVGEITPPRKTHDVPPTYPAEAQQKRIQGVVIINATISRTGCVSDARVTRSIPYLDIPALTAVTQWTFEPTRIADKPVPTIMNVTVNFQLR